MYIHFYDEEVLPLPYQNRLIVPGSREMLERYREEFGEELGIYHPAASRDILSSRLTRDIHQADEKQKNAQKE